MKPKIHLAFDTYTIQETFSLLNKGLLNYADIIECGGSLIFEQGLQAATIVKAAYPEKEIVVDVKMQSEIFPYYGKQFCEAGVESMILMTSSSDQITEKALQFAQELGIKVYMYLTMANREKCLSEQLNSWKQIGLKHVIYHSNHEEAPYWRAEDYEMVQAISDAGFQLSVTGKIGLELIKTFSPYHIYSFIIGTGVTAANDPKKALKAYRCEMDKNFTDKKSN